MGHSKVLPPDVAGDATDIAAKHEPRCGFSFSVKDATCPVNI